jgi:hypothetical protein
MKERKKLPEGEDRDSLYRIWLAMRRLTSGDLGPNDRPPWIWRSLGSAGPPMTVFNFEHGDGTVSRLRGKCRALGPIGDDLDEQTDPIGLWTADGAEYAIHVRTDMEEPEATFTIGDVVFFYPIVGCFELEGKLDPETGNALVAPRPGGILQRSRVRRNRRRGWRR